MINDDFLHLFFNKFKLEIPLNDENFNLGILLSEFKEIGVQTGIISILDNFKKQNVKLNKIKNFKCSILKKEDGSYEVIFELIKYKKICISVKIISSYKKCIVETFYSKSIKKHFKDFKIKNDNYSYSTDLMNTDIIFIEKYKSEVNHRQLYYKSCILNGINYELEKEIDFLNSNMTLYIDYGMSMKNLIKNYYTTKEGFKIYISFNKNSYEKIKAYSIEDKSNISDQVCQYLNEHKKDIEKLTEEDFKLIKLLNY